MTTALETTIEVNPTTAKPVRTPIYGATSEETAFIVADYPYGFQLRCKKAYWLETHKSGKVRLVTRTTNPKRGNVWNKNTDKSTYALIGGCLYQDEQGLVHWAGLSEYSNAETVLAFVQDFPQAVTPLIRYWVGRKILYKASLASGQTGWAINGVKQPYSDAERDSDLAEMNAWEAVKAAFPIP